MAEIAGILRLDDVLDTVRAERPVFHSEADFQHHLAWEVHRRSPDLALRLEVRPDPSLREQVDILVSAASGVGTVIELKYLKAAWAGVVADEAFALRNSGAHDIVRYDVLKDIARVERFLASRPGWNGLVLVLTNDAMHWRAPATVRETIAEAFRIHEGSVLGGDRAWGARAGQGTTRGREAAINLAGQYELRWRDWSHLDGRNGLFRLLAVVVTGDVTRPVERSGEPAR